MRFLAIVLAVLVLAIPRASQCFTWVNVGAKVRASMVQLQDAKGNGFCSGWVINNTRDFVITADHCAHSESAANGVYIDGIVAEEVDGSDPIVLDFAILHVPGIDRPELRPYTGELKAGMPVLASGYGYGLPGLDQRAGIISNPARDLSLFGRVWPGLWVVLDQSYIGGMSGGPVVNSGGKVVSMVQRGDPQDYMGIGRSITEIYAASKQYWK